MEGLFSAVELDEELGDRLPGTRLQRVELWNWGTFGGQVWAFDVDGRNALLTGDIGSGKSTLVDALSTLLLPSNKIAYNKAAGAENRERDLRSYVLGYYKAERNETTGAIRHVALRGQGDYSVLLGVFGNTDYDTTVTLAQVFWTKSQQQGQPERFFVVADGGLTIAEHFAGFGTDIAALRTRLRKQGAEVYNHFPDYGKAFRRRLGIDSEQAMELFGQTVSMKAVDNLNDFVRQHMLEPFDLRPRIEALVSHFDDLTKAHEAVQRARAQLELLAPLVAELDSHDELTAELARLGAQRDALPYFLADRRLVLLADELADLERSRSELATRRQAEVDSGRRLRAAEQELSLQIAGHGGDRIAALESEIGRLEGQRDDRQRRFDRFSALLAEAGCDPLGEVAQFDRARQQGAAAAEAARLVQAEQQNAINELRFDLRTLQQEKTGVEAELRSLRQRRSNIPGPVLELRGRLSAALRRSAEELPFAGELIQVAPGRAEWEGAAERVLHGFALSVLVPNDAYDAVRRWVDDQHLNGKFVYFRVPERLARREPPPRTPGLHLVDCLELKTDSPHALWLQAELERRAGHACVEDVADFRHAVRAVTRAGQVKDADRHEKDDRRLVDDRRFFVLGWSNQAKIDALLEEESRLGAEISRLLAGIASRKARLDEAETRLRALNLIAEYADPAELDWASSAHAIQGRQAELKALRASSDLLRTLTTQRDELRERLAEAEQARQRVENALTRLDVASEQASAARSEAERLLADEAALAAARSWFAAIAEQAAGPLAAARTAGQVERLEAQLGPEWTRRIEQQAGRRNAAEQRTVRRMAEFRAAYPAETAELDDSLRAGGEYRELYERVRRDDLPRFESQFKEYLNQGTINDIATFAAQLNKQQRLISDRVDKINESLTAIDYNRDRYIRLQLQASPNVEIRDFQAQLRACTDNLVGEASEQYSEQKFLEVRRLVDRFRGREGFTEADRNWTRRVTDVRNWFVFSASERWRADDTEHESYADSGGKSGGQKEKLAYTILAASLAYQFKLDWGARQSRSFRFVVIDEAFSRGSEESTRYALQLFTRLGLQLMIVTPLQKIHVIERYVAAVGFVDNPTGAHSRLQSFAITEFRRALADHGQTAQAHPRR